ncbi:HEAT repeat domain-containing protein [Leptolyngbya sp. FACHB-261]|uniref:HEAT repeat domain-containing protein n=1 Tax=Leptolyngbya sp. FACHB-261 TaxID=2692806 RepID=UPI001689C9F9|nr:HEAT repeat domain-containing protein [Leptolyngbya sp. FACHB-261]MBD2103779.1 HEAT repeat domain-containing protein [Leptolyngbya sp. FACHB-261]
MDDEDLSLLDITQPDSPLDHLEDLDAETDVPGPDPEAMLALLELPDPGQRMQAARAFCELVDERAVEPLIRLLADPCPLVRVSAAYALGRNPSPKAVAPLIAQLEQDWNGYVRKGVVWALGNSLAREALSPLVNALQTDITAVRLWAASSLAQVGVACSDLSNAAIRALASALNQDPATVVGGNCAWAIGQICRELPAGPTYTFGVDALIQALEDVRDLGVRDDARTALLKLGDSRGLQVIEELEGEGLL